MANPLIPQGTLNRLRASVTFVDNPQLNVIASFLGTEGINATPEGPASAYIPTLTGAVPSGEPFIIYTIGLHLLRTQGFAAIWKDQIETDTSIGDIFVTSDASTLTPYNYINCTIKTPPELIMNGTTPDFMITLQGTYYINSRLFG